jgi:hypothetical protein
MRAFSYGRNSSGDPEQMQKINEIIPQQHAHQIVAKCKTAHNDFKWRGIILAKLTETPPAPDETMVSER